jgi:hypothetical protein
LAVLPEPWRRKPFGAAIQGATTNPELVALVRERVAALIVVDTGCAAVANAMAGFRVNEASRYAGPGLREVCGALGILPP